MAVSDLAALVLASSTTSNTIGVAISATIAKIIITQTSVLE